MFLTPSLYVMWYFLAGNNSVKITRVNYAISVQGSDSKAVARVFA